MQAAVAALRAATQGAHRALEASPLPMRVMSRAVTLDDYRAFLMAQRALLLPFVEAYPAMLSRGCHCRPEARLEALHLDLAGLQDGNVLDEPLGHSPFSWEPEADEWWGALYVFEGSHLGGRVIARHLRQQLGFCVDGALRFLDPADDGRQPSWPAVAQCLERALPEPRRDAAVRGALATFESFRRAFARNEAHLAA